MRRFFMLAVLSLFAVSLPAAEPAPSTASTGDDHAADAAAIRAHIDSIFKAYIRQDRAAVMATHAKDWRGFLTGSSAVIRGIDQYMAAAEGSLRPGWHMTAYHFEDYDVVFHGGIGIVNYVAGVDGDAGGQATRTKLRVIDIYEKRDGQWLQIASNTATHPDIVEERIAAARAACK
jgi:ketosteroid isomerase-like protein